MLASLFSTFAKHFRLVLSFSAFAKYFCLALSAPGANFPAGKAKPVKFGYSEYSNPALGSMAISDLPILRHETAVEALRKKKVAFGHIPCRLIVYSESNFNIHSYNNLCAGAKND